jgi:predicted permease
MGLWHYFTRRKRERELIEELRLHREMSEEAFRRDDMPEADARFAAQRALGNVTRALEDSRSVWNLQWLESLMQDVRYAMRGFVRTPAFALTVVGTIGLALGLNTALFTIFNAYVLRPFAVHDPYSLYQFTWITKSGDYHRFTPKEFEAFRRKNPAFMDALTFHFVMTRTNGQPMLVQIISDNAFTMLGTEAALGRTLLPGDDRTLVLSDAAWKNKFGADAGIIGKKFEILGASYEVVGVARPQFTGLTEVPPDFWIPLITTGEQANDAGGLIGRLKPNITPDQAKAALAVWSRQATADLPEAQRATGVHFMSAATSIRLNQPGFVAVIAPVVIAFGLVLLIACANVANMMLARAMARQREIGVRLSLGAGRFRLVRQLLTESLLLSVPAAVAGVAISQGTIRATHDLMTRTAPSVWLQVFRMVSMEPDYRVFLFVFAAAVFSTLLFGLVPAIQATRPGVMYATRGDFSADIRPARLRNALVVCQVTVCVLLLICSGVLLHTGLKLKASDVRLVTEGVIDLHLSAPENFDSAIQSKIADRLREEPWVESVAAAWRAPLYGPLRTISVAPGAEAVRIRAGYNFVSPEYFDVFRIPLLRGRNFTGDESRAEAAVAIVSEATAARLWPGQDALGQSIRIDPNARAASFIKEPAYRAARVIGVAKDVMSGWVGDGIDATCIYFPTDPMGAKNISLLVRVKGDPGVALRLLDTVINSSSTSSVHRQRADGSIQLSFVVPMEQALAMQIYPFRASSWVASALGGLALALSLSGIYGVLSYLVSQRTKEIGIRMALGASTGAVVRIVLSQSMRLAVTGVVIGAALGLGVSRLFASELQNVDTFDAVAYLGSIGVALVAALAAACVPSLRAARVDPITALRCD